jgi:hypothetical protein
MITPELLNYIKSSLAEGHSESVVKEELLKSGWQQSQIDEAWTAVKSGVVVNNLEAPPGSRGLLSPMDLIKGSAQIYKNHFAAFFALSLITFVPFAVARSLTLKNNYIYLLVALISFLILVWGQLAIYYAAKNHGPGVSVKDSLKFGLRKLPSFIWISILVTLTPVVGYVFFIFPGILMAIWFMLATPVFVDEDLRGTKALLKSKSYVQGHALDVFLRFLIIGIAVGAISTLFDLIFGKTSNAALIANSILGVLVLPYSVIYAYELYRNLKSIKPINVYNPTKGERALIIIAAIVGLILPVVFFAFLFARVLNGFKFPTSTATPIIRTK